MAAIIVLADDEPDLRSVYATSLRLSGYDVHEAADGVEALELIEEHHPDLLLLDVWMPRLNGLEVIEHLRHDPLANHLKVVLLSNLGDSDTRLEGFSAGASDYWVKGLSLGELCQMVQRVLADEPSSCDLHGASVTHGD
jgi:CheY-like chemotaxis protein